jgi:hypothetical protein
MLKSEKCHLVYLVLEEHLITATYIPVFSKFHSLATLFSRKAVTFRLHAHFTN